MKILFLLGRNFGDTVIQRNNIEYLIKHNPKINFYLWCRSDFKYLFNFEKYTNVNFSFDMFPMGSSHKFRFYDSLRLIASILKLRNLKLTYGIDFTGDFRENILLSLITNKVISIQWPKNHPMKTLNRTFAFLFNFKKFIFYKAYENNINLYHIYNSFYKFISLELGIRYSNEKKKILYISKLTKYKIGLSPFASLECNTWPIEYWKLLIDKLLRSKRFEVYVFCDQTKKKTLQEKFRHLKINIISENINNFIKRFKEMDISVSNDSFASHLAFLHNKPNYIIYGANNPYLFSPPDSRIFFNNLTCSLYPCMNKCPCKKDTEIENFNCIKNIDYNLIYEAIDKDFLSNY